MEPGHELEQSGSRDKDWGKGTKRGEIKTWRRWQGQGLDHETHSFFFFKFSYLFILRERDRDKESRVGAERGRERIASMLC